MSETSPALFAPRACPLCGSAQGKNLLRLSGGSIIESNWSYRSDAAALLALPKGQTFPIDECGACGFIYAALLPSAAFLDDIYDRVIDPDLARNANLSRANLARKMSDMAALFEVHGSSGRPLRLLDYGCGFGPTLQVMRNLPGVNSLGFETSAARLQDLSRRGLAATGDLANVASQGPYDVVLLDNVLEHLPQPREVLEFVRGVSAAAALLYVSVPDTGRQIIRDQGRARPIRMDINPWEHLNYFDIRHLDKLLGEFGFHPVGQMALPEQVRIGLRASPTLGSRVKNGVASAARLCRYIWRGEGLASVTRRFYRLAAHAGAHARATGAVTP